MVEPVLDDLGRLLEPSGPGQGLGRVARQDRSVGSADAATDGLVQPCERHLGGPFHLPVAEQDEGQVDVGRDHLFRAALPQGARPSGLDGRHARAGIAGERQPDSEDDRGADLVPGRAGLGGELDGRTCSDDRLGVPARLHQVAGPHPLAGRDRPDQVEELRVPRQLARVQPRVVRPALVQRRGEHGVGSGSGQCPVDVTQGRLRVTGPVPGLGGLGADGHQVGAADDFGVDHAGPEPDHLVVLPGRLGMREGPGRRTRGEQRGPQRVLLVRLGLHPVVRHLAQAPGVRVDRQVGLHGHRQPYVQLEPARREQVLGHHLARDVVPEAVGALVGVRNQEVRRQRLVQRCSERAGRQVRSLGEDPVPQWPGCYRDQSDDELRVLRQRAEPQPHHVANPVRDAPGHTVLLGRRQLLDQERQAALRVSSRRMDGELSSSEPAHQVGDLLTGQRRHRDIVVRGSAQLLEGLTTTGLVGQLATVGDDHEQGARADRPGSGSATAGASMVGPLRVVHGEHHDALVGQPRHDSGDDLEHVRRRRGAGHVGRRQLGQQHVQVPPGATEE